jgi:hypothetical protein
MGENYWKEQVKKYCPLLEGEEIDIEQIKWTERNK